MHTEPSYENAIKKGIELVGALTTLPTDTSSENMNRVQNLANEYFNLYEIAQSERKELDLSSEQLELLELYQKSADTAKHICTQMLAIFKRMSDGISRS